MNILITGATGFIGNALSHRLASESRVIGIYHNKKPENPANIIWEQGDLTVLNSVTAICKKYSPDLVVHCAGIAQQKIGAVDSATYMRVNSEVTESLAKAAAKCNPDVQFIFLSSVSVYGEGPKINPQITQITQNRKDASRKGAKAQKRKNNSNDGVKENSDCQPSNDYAVSKLDAERRLIALFDKGIIHNLVILRLAPVYDRGWSFNLDRRVLAPMKAAYIRFGSGSQKMSALARPNLIDFIEFLIKTKLATDTHKHTGDKKEKKIAFKIFNVCDAEPYEFNTIIGVFKRSGIRPNRPVISIPLSAVWLATRIAGVFFSNKREWIHSCYDKLAYDLVFDNGKMIGIKFKPINTLENIFYFRY